MVICVPGKLETTEPYGFLGPTAWLRVPGILGFNFLIKV